MNIKNHPTATFFVNYRGFDIYQLAGHDFAVFWHGFLCTTENDAWSCKIYIDDRIERHEKISEDLNKW